MRSLWLLGTGVLIAGMSGTVVQAQQTAQMRGPGAGYSRPGAVPVPPAPMARPVAAPAANQTMVMRRGPNRWGSQIDGRWWGGANAPGGWTAYRRTSRGYVLPRYWVAPRFTINDWRLYGLAAPVTGYRWVRYYDDAVMIDERGSVYDSVEGVDWDGDRGSGDTPVAYDAQDERVYERRERRESRSDGVGGAVAGAVVGGVAGNVIAGRGDRLAGTALGAGVGAAAGYAIDRAEDRRRRERADDVPIAPDRGPRPGAGYGYPPYDAHHGGGPYHYGPAAGAPVWTSPDGRTTVVTTGGGYGSSMTTVTVQNAPVTTTTTTTETWEEDGGYARPARRVMRRTWKPRTKYLRR